MTTHTEPPPATPAPAVDLTDVQGNILRGYRKTHVRHLVVRVDDGTRGRAWMAAVTGSSAGRAPRVTDGGHWGEQPPAVCLNIGLTAVGLRALGVAESVVTTFPNPWVQGMAARASVIGDWDESAPAQWHPRYRDTAAVHLIVTLHANSTHAIDEYQQAMLGLPGGEALRVIGTDVGHRFPGDKVHFGYRDSIAQPRFEGITHPGKYDDQPLAPLGTVLLGYGTDLEELVWSLPDPAVLGTNGAFNAFRVLEQDVVGFEAWLDEAAAHLLRSAAANDLLPAGTESRFGAGATRQSAMREVVAAKVLGRWRNGTPLALSPHDPTPHPGVSLTDFDYVDDVGGRKCPFGAHIRRANPRGSKIVQRVANHTRRLVRRGFPYGPEYHHGQPADGIERGLLGSFLCANLEAQFEAIQYDWINLGLQDPRITGSNDPVIGANEPSASWFKLPTASGEELLRGFPRFVRTRGGAYLFLPSLTALRWIGSYRG